MSMSALTKDQAVSSNAQPVEPALPAQAELIRDLSNTFKLLSDETRLRILLYLSQ